MHVPLDRAYSSYMRVIRNSEISLQLAALRWAYAIGRVPPLAASYAKADHPFIWLPTFLGHEFGLVAP